MNKVFTESSESSKISMQHLENIIEHLRNNKHRSTTRYTYHKVWTKFNEFLIQLDHIPRKWEDRVSLYCGFLIEVKRRQIATVKSYVSAIKAVLQNDGYEWSDKNLLISTLVNTSNSHSIHKVRLPIRKGLLNLLLFELERMFGSATNSQPYLELMYKNAFVFQYYGLLRIGEITQTPAGHQILAGNIHKGRNKEKVLILLNSSKTHDESHEPQAVRISRDVIDKKELHMFSPFEITQNYLDCRGGYYNDDEPYFILPDGTPLSSQQLRKVLKKLLTKLDLDASLYDTHSFRIGRATDLLKYGYSVERIKKIGRWRSNAVYKYLREF